MNLRQHGHSPHIESLRPRLFNSMSLVFQFVRDGRVRRQRQVRLSPRQFVRIEVLRTHRVDRATQHHEGRPAGRVQPVGQGIPGEGRFSGGVGGVIDPRQPVVVVISIDIGGPAIPSFPSHDPCTRCLPFAAPIARNAAQDSLPAAGQALPDGIGYPLGSNKRFQPSTWLPPLQGFAWRNGPSLLDPQAMLQLSAIRTQDKFRIDYWSNHIDNEYNGFQLRPDQRYA